MKLLLTNDDGVDAPGLATLETLAKEFGEPTVLAPIHPHSGCGHRLTTDRSIRLETRGRGRFALDGTPADCVRVALHGLVGEVDWVLSGVNAGGNLGVDVHYSGTVAAIREATFHGRRGVAFSHYVARGRPIDWERAIDWLRPVLQQLLSEPLEEGAFWNVNLPHPPDDAPAPTATRCPLDPGALPLHYEKDGDSWRYATSYYHRPRQPNGDIDVCFGGGIAITKIRAW